MLSACRAGNEATKANRAAAVDWMYRVRLRRLEEQGIYALTREQANELAALRTKDASLVNKAYDTWNSALKAGQTMAEFKSADGIPVPTKQMIQAGTISETLIDLKEQERETLEALEATGGYTASQLVALSRETATDPVAQRLLETFTSEVVAAQMLQQMAPPLTNPDVIDQMGSRLLNNAGIPTQSQLSQATEQLYIDPSLKGRADLPGGLENLPTQEQEAQRQAQLAFREVAFTNPSIYRLSEWERSIKSREAYADLYWRNNYPKVELLASQNPNFDPALLTEPWPGRAIMVEYRGQRLYAYPLAKYAQMLPPDAKAWYINESPMVKVKVTPRKMPMPEKGFLADNPWVGAIVSAIPYVGQIAGMLIEMGTAAQLQSYADKFSLPATAFSPQYKPIPFDIPLPLHLAQRAVAEPWYVPVINEQFNMKMQALTRQAMANMGLYLP